MKKLIGLCIVCCVALNCQGRDDEPEGHINSVQKQSGEDSQGVHIEILKINTIQSGEPFEGVLRISVQLEDKKDQVAWGVAEGVQATGTVRGGEFKGATATGAVSWKFQAGSGRLKRPKIKAYTVEYGYRRGGEFIAVDEDMYKTDSFEELREANKDSLKLKCRLNYIYTVEN